MLWWFEKNGEQLQCEIRPSDHAAGFEMEVTTPNGEKKIEHAENPDELALRWHELEASLKSAGWKLKP
jgi:hypothetical protein